jgi:[protein-PII] uridylyltransferase
MAAGICERWGVYAATRELVVWLIKNHLLLSRFIHYRDPANPKTAQELAAEVESADRLVNLTLLTWADASNVGAGVWTPVQMTRMEELVKRTLPLLTQEQESTPDAVELRQRHVRRLSKEDVDETELQNFIESLPTEAIVAPPTEILRLYQVYKEAVENEAAVVSQPIPDVGVTEFTICGADRKGFLTEILAVLYAYDLSIHAVKAATTSESKPYAIDTLKVSSGARSLNPRTADRVSTALKDVLKGTRRGVDLLRDSGKDPGRVQEILSWRLHSGPIAILEVDAPRGRGMAYRMSSLIKEAGWNIVAARVGQWAGRGAGAFYIEHPSGQPISKADVQGAFDQPKV